MRAWRAASAQAKQHEKEAEEAREAVLEAKLQHQRDEMERQCALVPFGGQF